MMVQEAWRRMPRSASQQVRRNPLVMRALAAAGLAVETAGACSGGDADWPGRCVSLYASAAGVRALLAQLPAAERSTLETAIGLFANVPFTEAELVKRGGAAVPAPLLRTGLAGLCAAGIVVTARKAWGERLHALPYDALGAWQPALFGAPAAEVGDGEAELRVSALGRLDDDVFALLAHAAKQELPLTRQGTIHKRQRQALVAKLQLAGAEPLQRLGLSYAHAEAYDAGFAAALDAALRLGLLAAEGAVLRVQPERLHAWLRLPRAQRHAVVSAAWLERLWPSEPLGQHAAAAVLHAPRGAWLAMPALAAWLAGIAGAAHEPLVRLAAERWLEPLAALGWLELGRRAGSGELLLRVPPDDVDAQPEAGRIYVQPDFELVVPPDVPAHVRWQLEQFAERVSTDQVHVYRLSRESVRFGCERGVPADEITHCLAAHGMFELPDNVRQAIRQWAEGAGNGAVATAAAGNAARGLNSPETAAAGVTIETTCPTTATTAADDAGGVHALNTASEAATAHLCAASACFAAGMSDLTAAPGGASILTFIGGSNEAGLFRATDPLADYELEPELPERRFILPELVKEVPAVWWKDYRAYHASTRKEMIRKAIEWQSYVKLRMNGQDVTVRPKLLLEECDGWCLIGIPSGGGESRFAEGAWREMKLVVPGLNDA